MNVIKKILDLTFSEFLVLCEASFFLIVAFFLKRFLPFRFVAPLLGKHMASTPETEEDSLKMKIRPLKKALNRASKKLPLNSKCLDLAIAGKFMLRRRRIQSTVYLGVSKDDKEGLRAHAWVRSGKTIVTGAAGMEEHKVISSFA